MAFYSHVSQILLVYKPVKRQWSLRGLTLYLTSLNAKRSLFLCLFVFGATAPQWAMASSFTRFLDHTQWRTTVGRTPLDEGSARRRDLYLTTHNTHNRQTSMPPVVFEPTISAGERPQTYALDRAMDRRTEVYKSKYYYEPKYIHLLKITHLYYIKA